MVKIFCFLFTWPSYVSIIVRIPRVLDIYVSMSENTAIGSFSHLLPELKTTPLGLYSTSTIYATNSHLKQREQLALYNGPRPTNFFILFCQDAN